MTKHYPDNPWCRYADDGLVHCRTEQEAQALMVALDARFAQCALQMHPERPRCLQAVVAGRYPVTQFDFLGFLPAKGGEEQQAQQPVCELHPGGQQQSDYGDAGNDTQTEYRNRTGELADISRLHNQLGAGSRRKILSVGNVPVLGFNKRVAWA